MTAATVETRVPYEVLQGLHYQRKESAKIGDKSATHNVLQKGDVILSEEDLTLKWPNKFRRVPAHELPPPPPSRERVAEVAELLTQGGWSAEDKDFLEGLPEADFARIRRMGRWPAMKDTGKVASPLGEDVTVSFQQAYDNGFRVFRNAAGKHQVTKSNHAKPVNPRPLESKDVEGFVEAYLKEK